MRVLHCRGGRSSAEVCDTAARPERTGPALGGGFELALACDAIIAGERDPKVLAEKARSRLRLKMAELEEAFAGLQREADALQQRTIHVGQLDRDSIDIDRKSVV